MHVSMGSRHITCFALLLGLVGCDAKLADIPAPADPTALASLVTGRYIAGGYPNVIDSTRDDMVIIYHFSYPEGVTLWALLLQDELLGEGYMTAQVRASFESYNEQGRLRVHGGNEPIDYIGAMAHAIVEYSLRTGDERFLDKALEAARFFHEDAARTPDGLIAYHSDPQRGRIWVDALFMVTPLMAKAGRYLDDPTYYDDVLAQFTGFSAKLRSPTVGLYHQGWNWHGEGASPGYWGRANGWVAMAMVEVLDTIPEGYPGRDELLELFQDFAAALAERQGGFGMWHQLLTRPDSYEETSATGMIMYALSKGVARGWLDPNYVDVIERANTGLARMITLNGDIRNICPGTSTQSSEDDYFDRGPRTNDRHGIGPVLLGTYGLTTVRNSIE
jgi:rhamnogalacturonyl hydrolase YesR